MDANLKDKVALITGAAGGIGRATAKAFAAEGVNLVLHYHRNKEGAEKMAADLGVRSAVLPADLCNDGQTEKLFKKAVTVFPRIDILIVNAGIWSSSPAPLHEMSVSQWRNTLDADLTSAFLSCRAFLRHLAEVPRESAAIILVGSTAALFGEADHADYAAAKAAMTYGLTRTLKNEIIQLASRGRVNCVCPGWTETPMAGDDAKDPTVVKRITATMALRKIAQPEDVAATIVFLASDHLAGHITGAIVPIAGGMEGRLLHS